MDNHHVNVNGSSASCAILELSGITPNPDKVLYALATRLYHPARGNPAAVVIFSDVVEIPGDGNDVLTNGLLLCRAIMKHKLQVEVLASRAIENPLTGNMIKVWMWEIDHVAFKNWYREERVRRARKV